MLLTMLPHIYNQVYSSVGGISFIYVKSRDVLSIKSDVLHFLVRAIPSLGMITTKTEIHIVLTCLLIAMIFFTLYFILTILQELLRLWTRIGLFLSKRYHGKTKTNPNTQRCDFEIVTGSEPYQPPPNESEQFVEVAGLADLTEDVFFCAPCGEVVAFAVYLNNVLANSPVVRHLIPVDCYGGDLCDRLGSGLILGELLNQLSPGVFRSDVIAGGDTEAVFEALHEAGKSLSISIPNRFNCTR
jgi:hypothetical protein